MVLITKIYTFFFPNGGNTFLWMCQSIGNLVEQQKKELENVNI
jgi:hypothetical protein